MVHPLVFDQVSGQGAGSGLVVGWAGAWAQLGVVADRAPSGWGVIAAGVSGARCAGGFSSPWPVWGRVLFRFHKVGRFGVW